MKLINIKNIHWNRAMFFEWCTWAFLGIICICHLFFMFSLIWSLRWSSAWAVQLPGDDVSGQMVGAGKLLRLIDTGLFNWGSKLLAGLCIFSGGWHLKEMRIGAAVITIIAAFLIGTAPMWVRDIFNTAGAPTVFGN